MPRKDLIKSINWENKANRVFSKPVEYLSIILHEESPVVDDWTSEKFFHHKLKMIFCSREYLDDSILQEE